jgi:hypothetical protein
MGKPPEAMTKTELRAEILQTGASRLSNAALDAKPKAELLKIVQDDRRTR